MFYLSEYKKNMTEKDISVSTEKLKINCKIISNYL